MQNVARLIEYFVPEHYQLSLTLEREKRTFSGIVAIKGITTPGSDKIVVHAKDLSVTSVTFDGKEASYAFTNPDELTVTHPDIFEGEHIIVVAFHGAITDPMHGLYPCYYEHDGMKKELLATQFESHHAREVFPCIDEPEAKATFEVSLTTEKDITVLGNMPVKMQSEEDAKLVTTFETTPRMSTYLLAWTTGQLHKKTATTKSGVEVNIWATPAQKPESLDFALSVATRTIDFFDEYFGTPYPLPKSDHIALPDFSSGAMENWGLIAYREVALLADPATAGISTKQYIATVIAHELSHQWFGNLVTMKWWNNLWLNESFATLMEYIAVDALYPDWNMWLEFSTTERLLALQRDSMDGVQAVQIDVAHPDEISTLFDGAIVYAKGARLLRMLQHYIGDEAFQTGLRTYFESYAYKNTDGNDLWNEFSRSSGENIAEFMNTWISQPGYPVVHVETHGSLVKLQQKQFFIGPHEEKGRTWPVPLDATQANLPMLFSTASREVAFNPNEDFRLNKADSAHFITKYDDTLLAAIVASIQDGKLPALNRLQVLHEQVLLARSGEIKTAALILLLQAYRHETDEAVWNIISVALRELRKFVETDEVSEKQLRRFYQILARDQYQRLGWDKKEGESESDTKLRGTIVSMMLYGEDTEAIQKALELYGSHSIEQLDPELRSLIIATAVRHGNDRTIFPALIDIYKQTTSADMREDIASALTATKYPEDIQRIIAAFTDETVVRLQDLVHWFIWTIRNRDGREAAWKWLRDSWPWIKEKFGSDKSFDYFPRYSASALMTRKHLDEYKLFFTPLQGEPALTRVITLGISEIEGRIELIERDGDDVRDALRQFEE
jgi:aminopeptidase N